MAILFFLEIDALSMRGVYSPSLKIRLKVVVIQENVVPLQKFFQSGSTVRWVL